MTRQAMKITAVKTAVVEANYDYTYVRVYADSEEYGTGECFFAPGLTAIIRELAPVLVGKDPMHHEVHWTRLHHDTWARGGALGTTVLSGIDIALWDLLGKKLDQPVWRLLGYRRVFPKTAYASQLFGDDPSTTHRAAQSANGNRQYGARPGGRRRPTSPDGHGERHCALSCSRGGPPSAAEHI